MLLLEVFVFTLTLIRFSFWGVAVATIYLLVDVSANELLLKFGMLDDMQVFLSGIEYQKLDRVILPGEPKMETRIFGGVATLFHFFSIGLGFYPLMLHFYLGEAKFSKLAVFLIVLFAFGMRMVLYGVMGIAIVEKVIVVVPIILSGMYLKWKLPGNSKVVFNLFKQLFILILGVGILLVLPLFKNTEMMNMIKLMVLFPAMREVMRFIGTSTSWGLTSDVEILGGSLKPNWENGWPFVAWLLAFSAFFFRFQVANIVNPVTGTIIILYQAVIEVVLRITVRQRDEIIHRYCFARKSGKNDSSNEEIENAKIVSLLNVLQARSSFVHPMAMTRTESHVETDDILSNWRVARDSFYSLILIIEMITEYVSIIITPVSMLMFRPYLLKYPFEYYASFDNPFQIQPRLWELLSMSIFQLVVEIVVDSCCLYHETNRGGLDVKSIWKALPKRFTLLICLIIWYGFTFSLAFVIFGDDFAACFGKDMCVCVNNGLRNGGLREKYCDLLSNRNETVIF